LLAEEMTPCILTVEQRQIDRASRGSVQHGEDGQVVELSFLFVGSSNCADRLFDAASILIPNVLPGT